MADAEAPNEPMIYVIKALHLNGTTTFTTEQQRDAEKFTAEHVVVSSEHISLSEWRKRRGEYIGDEVLSDSVPG